MAIPIIYNKCIYKKKDSCYALVGFGEITKKAVKVKKSPKGDFVIFDGKRLYLDGEV